jgi:hypothetical protein
MAPLLLRSCLLAAIGLGLWLLLWGGRRFVERQQRLALAALPSQLRRQAAAGDETVTAAGVQILLFSSADCHQCHRLQKPALQRVQVARGERVSIVEIDAPSAPELTARYRVLTLPTTVVLDAQGRACAVNYGFAPTARLLAQVDAALSADPAGS